MNRALLLCVLVLLQCATGYCITDEVIWEQFEFNFAWAGARANSMGRAFVALADDATAAQNNPAGLILLTRPEVSFENKSTSFTSERPAAFDSLETGRTTDFGESVNSPAFASFVYPRKDLRIAVYRHEFLNYEEDFRLDKRILEGTDHELFQVDGNTDYKGVNWGIATAYRFSSKFFAGFSARVSRLDIETLMERENGLGPNTAIDGNDSKFTFSAGIIFNPVRKFSIGGFVEQNARYEFEETYQKKSGEFTAPISLVFQVPDRFAAGIAIRPTEGLTIVSDLVHVQYSELAKDIDVLFNGESTPEDFYIRDATEFHLGVEEIFFIRSAAVAVRGGIFTNPPHRLRYAGTELPAIAAFNFGLLDEHTAASYTFGGGVSISNQTQIDAAYILSDTFDEFSISFVLRF